MANTSNANEPYVLQVFQRLEEAQSSHGVPAADYSQYHAYCTKKLDRLRHNKIVRTQLVHNHKYVEGVSRRRHAYCPRKEKGVLEEIEGAAPVAASVKHENIFWNLFFQAERAWAQACALQQHQPQPTITTGKPKKQNNHDYVQRRLNKASKWAQVFAENVAASANCDAQTVQESKAYAAWMEGNAALEHKQYAAAYRHYKQSMTILLELAEAIKSTTADDLAVRDIWTTRAETVLRPLARYCQYEAKDELSAEDLAETTVPKTTAKQDQISSSIVLHFRGQDIALDTYKQMAVLYLKMEPSLKHPGSLDESQFLYLLSDLDDAAQMVATEIKQYESVASTGPAVTAKLSNLGTVQAYFRFQKLSVWRHQQEKRVAELQNDAEIVHVYDALQQNAVAMAELSAADEDDPYRLEAHAHNARIRALRCYYLARLYESTLNGTHNQVLALLKQSQKLSKRAIEEIAACDTIGETEADTYFNALDVMSVKIKAMKCRVEATKYLESSTMGFSSNTDRPLWLRLDELDAGTVLTDDPPIPIPMPCKGVFYDAAWQHVAANVSLAEIKDYIAAHEPKKSRFLGWFGTS